MGNTSQPTWPTVKQMYSWATQVNQPDQLWNKQTLYSGATQVNQPDQL